MFTTIDDNLLFSSPCFTRMWESKADELAARWSFVHHKCDFLHPVLNGDIAENVSSLIERHKIIATINLAYFCSILVAEGDATFYATYIFPRSGEEPSSSSYFESNEKVKRFLKMKREGFYTSRLPWDKPLENEIRNAYQAAYKRDMKKFEESCSPTILFFFKSISEEVKKIVDEFQESFADESSLSCTYSAETLACGVWRELDQIYAAKLDGVPFLPEENLRRACKSLNDFNFLCEKMVKNVASRLKAIEQI